MHECCQTIGIYKTFKTLYLGVYLNKLDLLGLQVHFIEVMATDCYFKRTGIPLINQSEEHVEAAHYKK